MTSVPLIATIWRIHAGWVVVPPATGVVHWTAPFGTATPTTEALPSVPTSPT